MTLIAERPAPSAPRPFQFPAFTRTTLPNGLTLIVCDLPGRPLGTATLCLDAGAFVEDPARAGVALLTARALQEGTRVRDAAAFADAIEGLGADLSTATSTETMLASVRAPVSRLSSALSLLAEAVVTPAFPAANVERLRNERLAQISQEREVPASRAMEDFAATVYTAATPYSRPLGGTAQTVAAIDRDAIAAHRATHGVPTRATLIIAGDLRGLDIEADAAAAFGAWEGSAAAAPQPEVTEALAGRTVRIIDRPGSVQSNIVIGHAGVARSAPDHTALEVVEHIFGGSFGCRLNTRLREEKGYTYGARGGFDFRRHGGPFWCYAPVEASVTAPAALDMVELLTQIAADGITDEELMRARAELSGGFALRFETAEAVANGIVEMTTYGLPDDTFDTYDARLQAVTVGDATAAARARIHPDRLAIVVVGDAATIAEPLRDAGLGTVTVLSD